MMKYTPCNDCPFRSNINFPLGKKRAKEIVNALYADGAFHCHKTIDYSSGSPVVKESSQLCAGSAIFLEKTRPGGLLANLAYRLDVMFRGAKIDKLNKTAPVYNSAKEFIDGTDI